MATPINLDAFSIAVDGDTVDLDVSLIATFGEMSFEVPDPDYIPNHSERALKLLIEQFDADTV